MMGKPESVISVRDNGGKTLDRYVVIFDPAIFVPSRSGLFVCLSLSKDPDDPQFGISQFDECVPGDHLGKIISWNDLPEAVREHIVRRLSV